jgi:serine/threonine-protein kinase
VPFSGDSPIAVGYKHIKESCQPLKDAQSALPGKLSSIVDRLLQKDPAHRYQSIQELRKDLLELHPYRPLVTVSPETAVSESVKIKT